MAPSRKRPAAALKRPAAANGPPEFSPGWEQFQTVPYLDSHENFAKTSTSDKFGGLSFKSEVTKAPALVKHLNRNTQHTSAGAQSVKDFLKFP